MLHLIFTKQILMSWSKEGGLIDKIRKFLQFILYQIKSLISQIHKTGNNF